MYLMRCDISSTSTSTSTRRRREIGCTTTQETTVDLRKKSFAWPIQLAAAICWKVDPQSRRVRPDARCAQPFLRPCPPPAVRCRSRMWTACAVCGRPFRGACWLAPLLLVLRSAIGGGRRNSPPELERRTYLLYIKTYFAPFRVAATPKPEDNFRCDAFLNIYMY